MNCKKTQHNFNFYITGELSQEDRKSIDVHMANCSICASRFAKTQSILTAIDDRKYKEKDPFFITRTLQKLANKEEQGHRVFLRAYILPAFKTLLVAASVAIGIFIGIQNANYVYPRESYVSEFAEDYFLFETQYEPLEEYVFNESEE